MSSSNFILEVDPACGEIPQAWREDVIPRMGEAMKEGARGMLYRTREGQRATYYLHRRDLVSLLLTMDPEAAPVAPRESDWAWAAPLWKELEEGADTPEGRRALAHGMTARLPCGPCKKNWPVRLAGNPPPCETNDGFRRWVRAERNAIARSKGRPLLPDLP